MDDTTLNRQKRLGIVVILVCWLLGYWSPWLSRGSGTAWLELSSWCASRGLHDLQTSSLLVTAAITACALVGAVLRVVSACMNRAERTLQEAGLLLTCAPLAVLLPAGGALLFLVVLAMVALYRWRISTWLEQHNGPPWQRLLRESFPILVAGCFLTMSWQYNAQWLMRGLLVSAGCALLARAVLAQP